MADRSLLDDSRYVSFAKRYAFDINRFAGEVVGLSPTGQQAQLFKIVAPAGSRTSISSGHGVGKTGAFGVISLWHLLCYPHSNTFLSAPKLKTLQEGVAKELAAHRQGILTGMHPWIAQYLVIEHERFFIAGHKQTWFGTFRTAPRGSPENLAGSHNAWLIWLIDEASGVPDANFGVIGGSMTDERNRLVLASQPTRPSGFFYDTHHKMSQENGGPWNALTFNSEDSGLVSDSFIRDKLLEYGGIDAEEYQIKVRGRFPENQDGYLLGRALTQSRIMAAPTIREDEMYGNLLLIDVGAGEYRDKSVCVHARVIGEPVDFGEDVRRMDVVDIPIFTNTRQLEDFTGQVFHIASGLSNCTILVDAGGMGIYVSQKLERLGCQVIRVKWGSPCFKQRHKDRFFNQRAQAMCHAARAVREGRVSVLTDRYQKDLLDQASRIPYSFDEKARYSIMKKEDMRANGIPSPDLFDAISFGFLEDATYMISEGAAMATTTNRQTEAMRKAMEAFGITT